MRNCCYKKMMMNNKVQNNKCCNNTTNNKNNNFCSAVNNNSNNCECNNTRFNCCDNNDNYSNKELMNKMKLELQECKFAIQELALYLDIHPEDTRAICMHNEQAKRYRKLADEYEKVYGPLTIMFPCNSWRWLEEPWPWENRADYSNYTMNNRGNDNASCIEENLEKCDSEQFDFELKGGII